MLNILSKNKVEQAEATLIAVEYHAPHWVILVKAAGQPQFSALRHPTRRVSVFDDYGQEKSKFAPIEAFADQQTAMERAREVVPEAKFVSREAIKPGYWKSMFGPAAQQMAPLPVTQR